MSKTTKVDQWRISMGLSYQDLADRIGCTRQYAEKLCKNGTSGVSRAFRVIQLSAGKLQLEDFISELEKEALREEGYDIKLDDGFDEELAV